MKKRINKTKKRINKKNTKKENNNKNTNKNNNVVHVHFGNHRKPIYGKSIIKREIVKVPEIKTFTPLHQLTNYVPMSGVPQTNRMMSHPSIPSQQSIVRSNPLVNPLRDMTVPSQSSLSDNFRTLQEARKKESEEIQRRIDEHNEHKKQNKGVSLGEIHNLSSPIKQGTLDFSYLPVSRYISKTPQKNMIQIQIMK